MSGSSLLPMSELPSHPTRVVVRAGVPAVAAGLITVALVLALYAWMPIPQSEDSPAGVVVGIAFVGLLYLGVAIWSVGRISKSRHPLRAGMTVLGVMITAVVVLFALTYVTMSTHNVAAFNVPLDKISSLYFTLTILTTVGFGDIHAVTHPAMIAVMVQMVVSLTLITTVGRVIVSTAKSATRRQLDKANAEKAGPTRDAGTD